MPHPQEPQNQEPIPTDGRLLTVATLAHLLGRNVHQIRYAIDRHRIRPSAWVGHTKVYNQQGLQGIREALRLIDLRKGGGAS
jgi:hypothetical protein